MSEFERAVLLLLAAQIELLRHTAAYHSPSTEEQRTLEVPERLKFALGEACPEAAAFIDAAVLRRPRGSSRNAR